jgi:hypothetical protein
MKVTVEIPVMYTTTIDIDDKCLTKEMIEEPSTDYIDNLHDYIKEPCNTKLNNELDAIESKINSIEGFKVKEVNGLTDNYVYYKD